MRNSFQRRWLALSGCALLAAVGIVGGFWWSAVERLQDPMHAFTSIPRFEPASWMPEEPATRYARLINDVARRRVWTEEDARFILALLRRPRGPDEPPIPLDDVEFSLLSGSPDQIERFLMREGAAAAIAWNLNLTLRAVAWAVVQDRIRLGLNVPEPTRSFAVDAWLQDLSSPDSQARLESAVSLISARLVQDEATRLRVEALWHGDPSADVRRVVAMHLDQFDRREYGIEPGGRPSRCNTCP